MFECSQDLRVEHCTPKERFSVRQKSAINILLVFLLCHRHHLGKNRILCERGVGRYRFAHLVPAPW